MSGMRECRMSDEENCDGIQDVEMMRYEEEFEMTIRSWDE